MSTQAAFELNRDVHYVDSEYSLNILAEAINQIHNRNNSRLSFEELYRNVYNAVTNGKGRNVYDLVIDGIRKFVSENIRENIKTNKTESFLTKLKAEWDNHLTSLSMIRSIFMYLEAFMNKEELQNFYDKGLNIFQNDIILSWDHVRTQLQDIINGMILAERNGDLIEHSLIKSTCDMLAYFDLKNTNLLTYEAVFERKFLKNSEYFYELEAKNLIDSNDGIKYIRNFKKRVDEEKERVKRCLKKRTEQFIIDILYKKLIEDHLDNIYKLQNGLERMLKESFVEDIKNMYELYCLYGTEWRDNFFDTVLECFRKEGTNIVQTGDTTNGIEVIQDLLDLQDKYENFSEKCFDKNEAFQKLLSSSLIYIINLNSKIPEYLCEFMNSKLTKVKNESDDNEVLQNKCVQLFRILEAKDIFMERYKTYMMKRIIARKLVSIEFEQQIVSKFKMECGSDFTQKLEALINDLTASNKLMENYKNFLEGPSVNNPSVDISVIVIGCRGIAIEESSHCVLPAELYQAFEVFSAFYGTAHESRKLTLHPSMGSASVSAKFLKKTYTLEMSTLQVAVISLFNINEKMTFKDILTETGMSKEKLIPIIKSFCFCKPAIRLLQRFSQSKNIEETDVFSVNASFKSQLNKVKIPKGIKPNVKGEKDKDENRVAIDREDKIDAAVVRLMKSRQQLQHNVLMSETINILKTWFRPSPDMIKKRLEALIEKEYLRRSPDDKMVYLYIA